MSVMYLIAFEMAYAKGRIDEAECKRLTEELKNIPEVLEKQCRLRVNVNILPAS